MKSKQELEAQANQQKRQLQESLKRQQQKMRDRYAVKPLSANQYYQGLTLILQGSKSVQRSLDNFTSNFLVSDNEDTSFGLEDLSWVFLNMDHKTCRKLGLTGDDAETLANVFSNNNNLTDVKISFDASISFTADSDLADVVDNLMINNPNKNALMCRYTRWNYNQLCIQYKNKKQRSNKLITACSPDHSFKYHFVLDYLMPPMFKALSCSFKHAGFVVDYIEDNNSFRVYRGGYNE